jgi:hypothetical protein
MSTARNVYFGWSTPAHAPDCPRPVWDVDTMEHDASRERHGAGDHKCRNRECNHGGTYTAMTFRFVCRSCERAYLYRTEVTKPDITTTREIGYGAAPIKAGGLWLYPGSQLLFGDAMPYDYLCTCERVDRLQPEDVVGYLVQNVGKRNGTVWQAGALPRVEYSRWSPCPQLVYTVTSKATTFRKVGPAAKWIREQVEAAAAQVDAAQPAATQVDAAEPAAAQIDAG